MKHRNAQFAARKNPDSPRVHGLRLAVGSSPEESVRSPENPRDKTGASSTPPRPVEAFDLPLTDASDEATVGREGDRDQLLTVGEVADLLRVPVSWVYGKTRERFRGRLPGYRLGKYWRFKKDEVLAWVMRHGGVEHGN